MKLFLILSSLLAIQAGVIKEESIEVEEKVCDGIIINGTYHEQEILHRDLDRPFLLSVDHSTNDLYFSYNVKVDEDDFRSARLNLNSKEFKNIEGVSNGFAQAVDPSTNDIYIGGSDGIYKYDPRNNKAELFAQRGMNIWTLYYKDFLYFSNFPSQFLYVLIDGKSERLAELQDTKVEHFVIDNEDVMFYTNNTGLYGHKKGTLDSVLYKEIGSIGIRALTTDINGNVYACFSDGVYAVRKATQSLEKIFDIDDAFGLAFDNNNNIVYSDAVKLIRLRPNRSKSC
ncbi:ommochrome-binding protein-like [Manduca sexta]|uniref:ommochrome-binding protein-like n=1 Tax=Manduca sexta TaxID=7130 RepID=UPI001183333E|nr:ommochrome-binding protein-like [Manduca sexta]XP_030032764.1 ommochrome-binding protein-like [Manduca sexta]